MTPTQASEVRAATDAHRRPPRSKRTSLLLRLAVSLVTFLGSLGIAEVALRVVAPLPFASDLRWVSDGHVKARLDPEQEAFNRHGNRVRLNALGFRGPEVAPRPAPETLRIVALGGSATFCFDVTDDEHTWPARLASRLSDGLGMPVEVVNLGLPGYDAASSKVNYLFTGRALHPHVVLVYHTWNDMKLLRAVDASAMLPRDALSGRRGASMNESALAHLFWDAQLVQRGRLVYLGLRDGAWETYYTSLEGQGQRAEAPVGERGWRWFRQNFVDLARFARADGVLPVLISQATLARPEALTNDAHRVRIRNELLGMTLPRLVESWRHANSILRDVADEERAPFVAGHEAVPADLEHLIDHVHLTDAGADRLAAGVADRLLDDPRFRGIARRVRDRRPSATSPSGESARPLESGVSLRHKRVVAQRP